MICIGQLIILVIGHDLKIVFCFVLRKRVNGHLNHHDDTNMFSSNFILQLNYFKFDITVWHLASTTTRCENYKCTSALARCTLQIIQTRGKMAT